MKAETVSFATVTLSLWYLKHVPGKMHIEKRW